jgi:adenine phosphoribosyltransferase
MTSSAATLADDVKHAIREVPDFPKPGINYKDITPLLADPKLFPRVVRAMADPFRQCGVTHVAAVESRGFLLGAPAALELGAALIPLRKPGKLPSKTASIEYALEYGSDRLEIHADACDGRARVLIVDDVLATGGTAAAAGDLLRDRGANVVGYSFLMILSFLGGRKRLGDSVVSAVLTY